MKLTVMNRSIRPTGTTGTIELHVHGPHGIGSHILEALVPLTVSKAEVIKALQEAWEANKTSVLLWQILAEIQEEGLEVPDPDPIGPKAAEKWGEK